MTATPAVINPGDSVTLTVQSANASAVTIDNGVGNAPLNGAITVKPTVTTTFTATASGNGKTATGSALVTVSPKPLGPLGLTITPATITSGQVATISWSVPGVNAQLIRIYGAQGRFNNQSGQPTKNGVGVFANNLGGTLTANSGHVTISPTENTTYTAVATMNDGQTVTDTAVLGVTRDLTKLKTKVKHVIYMLQENRSFDMHFGKLNDYRAAHGMPQDVDGLPAGATMIGPDNLTLYTPYKFRTSCVENLTPDWLEQHGDYNNEIPSSDTPKLNGFLFHGSGMARFSGRVVDASGTELNNIAPAFDGSFNGTVTIKPSEKQAVGEGGKDGTATYYLFRERQLIAWIHIVVNPLPPGIARPGNPPTGVPIESGVVFTASDGVNTVAAGGTLTVPPETPITFTYQFNAPLGTKFARINRWFDQTGIRAMGYYDDSVLPWHYFMASNFATSDRFFSPFPGNSAPNRAYALAATTAGAVHDPGSVQPPGSGRSVKNIFELVQAAGHTWKVYYSTPNPALGDPPGIPKSVLTRFHPFSDDFASHLVPISQYFTDVANNTLPEVAFIDERSGLDEHPGGTIYGDVQSGNHVQRGANYVADIINKLMDSPSWPDSVFFLSYDEFGGQYEHVVPPDAVHPDGLGANTWARPADNSDDRGLECKDMVTQALQCGPNPPPTDPTSRAQDFDRTGFRVPLIVVSPWTKKNYVSHTTADFTAILKFIESRFDLPNLTERDRVQTDLLEFFDFDSTPWLSPPSSATRPVQPFKFGDPGYLQCNTTTLP